MEIASPRLAARRLRQGGTIAALAASLLLGACGQTMSSSGDLLSVNGTDKGAKQQKVAQARSATTGGVSEELLKATDYWGQIYAKSPRELEPALNYARNLKAMGEKRRALGVLQQASIYHGESRELASEYGRLALDLDQVTVAKQLLAIADDPAKPDWRVVSARGAALAKEGKYEEAIPFFERARELSQDAPSVISNLALAYAMNGEPVKAEPLLRQAAAREDASPRIRQNLALVLGLQGKYDESKVLASRDITPTKAAENADYLRQVVKLDAKDMPGTTPEGWNTQSQMAEMPAERSAPVERVARTSVAQATDTNAAGDGGWVVDTSGPSVAADPSPSRVAQAGR